MQSAAAALDLYRSSQQCLIHNDLHAGNLLVAPGGGTTALVDWEFATYGPAAYDLGSLAASLTLATVAVALGAPATGDVRDDRAGQFDWLMEAVEEVWGLTFEGWWRKHEERGQEAGGSTSSSSGGGRVEREEWERELLRDTLAFAGCCMCRLIVGQHSYQLFAHLRDQQRRVRCERAALTIGHRMLAERDGFSSMREVVDAIIRREVDVACKSK